jgi:hypothetical protein
MVVAVNGKKYGVRWERWWIDKDEEYFLRTPDCVEKCTTPLRPDEVKNTIGKLMVTKCVISKIDESKQGRDKYNPVHTGISVQSPKDSPNKFSGRKYSLTRAIDSFNKTARTEFWKVFVLNQLEKDIMV